MYGAALSALGSGGMGAPPSAPPTASLGAGMGAPPAMPGLPPPPSNQGAMPVGDLSTDKKAAADDAVLRLRTLSQHYPALKPMLESTIDAIKAVASTQPSPAPPGEPAPPGSPMPDLSTPDSGSPGAA